MIAFLTRPVVRAALVVALACAVIGGAYFKGVYDERARAAAAAASDYIEQRNRIDDLPPVPADPDDVLKRLHELPL